MAEDSVYAQGASDNDEGFYGNREGLSGGTDNFWEEGADFAQIPAPPSFQVAHGTFVNASPSNADYSDGDFQPSRAGLK